MAAANKQLFEKHSFKSFLEKYHVIIPMVQRDYAQGRTTDDVNRVRSRFLEAIKQCLSQESSNTAEMRLDFVYGEIEKIWSKTEKDKLDSIVVTPLDGQQRLTTLYLLHWYASRKELVQPDNDCDIAFLQNFTYDIRPSSRDFCSHLIQFIPNINEPISEQLKDQNWFMGEWHNDPTVLSMLVMLDSIQNTFKDIENLWNILTSDERIVFYFLPLSENGMSDELYIKMNSRGKKLTAFEHFKAEYESLYEKDSEESALINHKFDVEWTDTLFPYRNSDETVDREFMRYFFYISHILCYEQSVQKSNDEFVLIKSLYKDSPNANNNRQFFEKAFDCWHYIMLQFNGIDNFFKEYLSDFSYVPGKVATYKRVDEYLGCQNFFNACIKLYQVNNNFSYSDFLFLYGFIIYIIYKESIKEEDFRERLRILRNLIWNSNSGEIRSDAEYMKDLLAKVKELIIYGTISQSENTHGFKPLQEEEEIEKQKRKASMTYSEISDMYTLEDHPLLYGYISGIKYENMHLASTFNSVFCGNDLMAIHQAMIAIGDYLQYDDNRYYSGNSNRSTWAQLLHKSNKRGFEDKTMPVLISLLETVKSGKTLNDIITDFTSQQETLRQFTWRYYFAKYSDMQRGSDGEMTWSDNDYVCTVLNKHQFNGQHWNPFLNVINNKLAATLKETYSENVIKLENYGENLYILHPSSSVESTGQGFIYYIENGNEQWTIEQSEGIDQCDRIIFAINKITEIVKLHYAANKPNNEDENMSHHSVLSESSSQEKA